MPADVQDGIMWGSEMTAHQNLAKVPSARAYAMAELAKAGVEFHSLSEDQLANGKTQAATSVPNGTSSRSSLQGPWMPLHRWKKPRARRANTTSTTLKQPSGALRGARYFLSHEKRAHLASFGRNLMGQTWNSCET